MSNQSETPVHVDTSDTKPPRAAEFGKGLSDLAGAQTAQDARCHPSPATNGKRNPDRDGRASLQTLLIALDASPLSLRRDFWSSMGRRGDHAIHGKRGHIYPDGDGYLLCVGGQSARIWSAVKSKLSFCQLRIDGDDEGTLHLDHLPSPAEAKAIRQVMAIRKRRKPSGEARPALDRHFTPDISTVLTPHIHFSGRVPNTYFARGFIRQSRHLSPRDRAFTVAGRHLEPLSARISRCAHQITLHPTPP